MKVIIVGGVAGGANAAARLRRLDEQMEILILERSGYISYANCGLPYYIGGEITERGALTLQTPERFWERFRIEVRTHNEVTAIRPDEKTVTVRNIKSGGVYTIHYDKLILSPGAAPVRPKLPGVDDERVFTLRSVEDALNIAEFIEMKKPCRAIVVGGGFIGLEMAENLVKQNIEVTLVEMLEQVLPPFDYDMACEVHARLRAKDVQLRLGGSVTGFTPLGDALCCELSDGETLPADMVLLAIGVAPDTILAAEAGLALGTRGAIVVNERMQTSQPDIYAVGDAVEIMHFVSGQKGVIPLAGPANKQGRIAADNICGLSSRFRGTQGSSILKVFDTAAASTGMSETAAKSAGIDCEAVVLFSAAHATYYPGAQPMAVKGIFEKGSGRLLGAQIVGGAGVDKRIDVLGTAIRSGLASADLAELELAYAPPYSSVKDPVNMLGFVMENIRAGLVKQFYWHQVAELEQRGAFLLDVRTRAEFQNGHFGGAVNVPLDELRENLDKLNRNTPLYVNCQTGLRSYTACRILSQNGFDCYNLAGGYRFYEIVTGETA